jgi:hypothetical protein
MREAGRLDRVGVEQPGVRRRFALQAPVPGLGDESFGITASHLRDLQRMVETVMEGVAALRRGHLGDVGEPLEGRAVEDPVAIPLGGSPHPAGPIPFFGLPLARVQLRPGGIGDRWERVAHLTTR